MSEELVARLRADALEYGIEWPAQAADAIEELRAERDRWVANWEQVTARLIEQRAENERLKAEVSNWEQSFPMCHMSIEGECSAEQRWKAIIAEQRAEVERLKAERDDALDQVNLLNDYVTKLRAACGGLSPEAVEWAVRIAAELMAEWEEGSTHADTYYIVEAWWRSCPPDVRAQILKES